MTEQEILDGIKKYFTIEEFVSKATFDRHGERAWKFLNFRLLHTILVIRIALDKSITGNTWKWGGYNATKRAQNEHRLHCDEDDQTYEIISLRSRSWNGI